MDLIKHPEKKLLNKLTFDSKQIHFFSNAKSLETINPILVAISNFWEPVFNYVALVKCWSDLVWNKWFRVGSPTVWCLCGGLRKMRLDTAQVTVDNLIEKSPKIILMVETSFTPKYSWILLSEEWELLSEWCL